MIQLAVSLLMVLIVSMEAQSRSPAPPDDAPIYVNHMGYLPASSKIALVSAVTGLPFEVVRLLPDDPSGKTVLNGMLKLRSPNDPFSGAHVWEADFSILRATGTYRIHVEGLGESHPFQIAPNVYASTANHALKSFYYHRSGVALPEKFAGEWSREAWHENDAPVYPGEETSSRIHPATGGWYDGGGMGKYTVSGAFAVGMLLQLYEMKPHLFSDRAIGIPEFNNGVPDILDEVRWELEWLMRMQREDGAVYHKVTAKEPETSVKNGDTPQRYILPVSTAATASACAALAKASRVYQHVDSDFAERCLNAAQQAWSFLSQHPAPIVFENPEGFLTKTYADNVDEDERIWAAVELFISTGQPGYYTAIQMLVENRVPLISSAGYWAQVMPLAAGSVVVHPTPFHDSKFLQEIKTDLSDLSDTLIEKTLNSGFLVSLRVDEFLWGSNNTLLQNAHVLLTTHYTQPQPVYLETALHQLHYVLGRNPLSMSFVTAVGGAFPQKPYHFYRHILKDAKPIPGLLVSGPNSTLGDRIIKKHLHPASPPGLIYQDDPESFSTNETSILWNAAFSFVSAWMSDSQ